MEIDNTERANSTVPRRQLGRFLRQQRESAGKTIKVAAEYMECSTQKLWRIEKGAVPVRGPEVKMLCDFYGTDAGVTEALVSLAKETKARGWWQSYNDVVMPDWFELYVGLEGAAARIRTFEPQVVPGLLQAPSYMEAVMRADTPQFTDTEVLAGIKIKQQRQGLLSRHFPPPPHLEVIVSEAVLLASTDIPGAMQQQLWHLLKANEEKKASVRVLPLTAGLHRASGTGKFTILEFPSSPNGDGGAQEPPTVYSDSVTGALYLDKANEIEAYEQVWNDLDSRSLDMEGSNAVISKVLREKNHHEGS
ncbi:transcriptional regulator with XRE-family HTH domain [Actinoplanes tereljensis]|uniref:Transcriptional regulator n=1 Tax=Paractinoplanes tereljensis TaxID=571912 RepID=A0A919NVB0_9ACTN|nr:helix-turn-helix transcriptional regulator [Actinoplanes tereljensis]GIF25914.1 transcriptional regulator [Actinoplanes tereljensis]